MLKSFLFRAAAATALSACTYDVRGKAEDRSVDAAGLVASRNVDVPGDAEFSGMFVGADGRVGRDLELSGATVRSNMIVGRDLEASGGRVRFTGEVGGDAEISAGTADIDARIAGNTQIAAGRVTLDGHLHGSLEMDGGHMVLRADVDGPVTVRGHGRDDGDGRVEIFGRLGQGGLICAAEVELRSGARLEGGFLVISHTRPDGEGFEWEALGRRDCEDL
ncbi:MAG: hypothetical protein CMH93_09150 [Oceanicaulis sp.]|nr:hypothetical protein [Oceanicaulis sp.]